MRCAKRVAARGDGMLQLMLVVESVWIARSRPLWAMIEAQVLLSFGTLLGSVTHLRQQRRRGAANPGSGQPSSTPNSRSEQPTRTAGGIAALKTHDARHSHGVAAPDRCLLAHPQRKSRAAAHGRSIRSLARNLDTPRAAEPKRKLRWMTSPAKADRTRLH
jgi:hypothetical protein